MIRHLFTELFRLFPARFPRMAWVGAESTLSVVTPAVLADEPKRQRGAMQLNSVWGVSKSLGLNFFLNPPIESIQRKSGKTHGIRSPTVLMGPGSHQVSKNVKTARQFA